MKERREKRQHKQKYNYIIWRKKKGRKKEKVIYFVKEWPRHVLKGPLIWHLAQCPGHCSIHWLDKINLVA